MEEKDQMNRPSFSIGFVISILGVFLFSFMIGYLLTNPENIVEKATLPSTQKSPLNQKRFYLQSEESNATKRELAFYEKIKKKWDSTTFNELFEEAFPSDNYSKYISEDRQLTFILAVGKNMPLQGLKRLEEIPQGRNYICPLLMGWASVNPDAALNYYNQHYKNDPEFSEIILPQIVGAYGKESPEEAWKWLNGMKDSLSPELYTKAKKQYIESVISEHPESIPELAGRIDIPQDPDELATLLPLWRKMAYYSGLYNVSNAWMDMLPVDIQSNILPRNIVGIAKDNLETLSNTLSQYPSDQRETLIQQMLPNIIDGGTNKSERVQWIIDNVPAEKIERQYIQRIREWMVWDAENASTWLQTLPPSPQKELLLKTQEEAEVIKNRWNP